MATGNDWHINYGVSGISDVCIILPSRRPTAIEVVLPFSHAVLPREKYLYRRISTTKIEWANAPGDAHEVACANAHN